MRALGQKPYRECAGYVHADFAEAVSVSGQGPLVAHVNEAPFGLFRPVRPAG